MTVFEAVKQLELDVFCDVMYGAAKDTNTQEELKAALQTEITEEALQQINEAALREGYQPLSFIQNGNIRMVSKVENDLKQLESMCLPIMMYLKGNCNPYTEICVTSEGMVVKQTVIGIPNEKAVNRS